jgi:hypothetical protein
MGMRLLVGGVSTLVTVLSVGCLLLFISLMESLEGHAKPIEEKPKVEIVLSTP